MNLLSPTLEQNDTSVLVTQRKTRRALCVEDHADTCELITFLLRQRGWTVRSVANLGEAEALLQNEEFDLLIADLLLPDGNGAALCRKAHEAQPRLKTLLTSIASIDAQDLRILGADAYLPKPIEPDLLLATIDRLLSAEN